MAPAAAAACRRLADSTLPCPGQLQAECIPKALEGRDVVARARTGSGKTLAYLLPALHRVLAGGKGKMGWQALVLVPTRELCEQVRDEQGGNCCMPWLKECMMEGWDVGRLWCWRSSAHAVAGACAELGVGLELQWRREGGCYGLSGVRKSCAACRSWR